MPEEGQAASAPSSQTRQRVLIVEDEENARKGYEALLRKWGCEVLGVGSGEDALARFREFQPAVMIADVELPGMNGLELIQRLGEPHHGLTEMFIVADGESCLFQQDIATIDATLDLHAPHLALPLARRFEDIWAASEPAPGLHNFRL